MMIILRSECTIPKLVFLFEFMEYILAFEQHVSVACIDNNHKLSRRCGCDFW